MLIKEAVEYINKNKHKVNNKYRQTYHIQGEIGWINDPNGFSYANGYYHIFYQYHPYSDYWGPMHWGHRTSKNLIKWSDETVSLAPLSNKVDGGAAFSGAAVFHYDLHILYYTEHSKDKQVIKRALSRNKTDYTVDSNFIVSSNDVSFPLNQNEFRDPFIFTKENRTFCLIASMDQSNNYVVVLFEVINFQFIYRNIILSKHQLGNMIECPVLIKVDDKDVLICSFLDTESVKNKYKNIASSVAFIGNLNLDNYEYTYIKSHQIHNGFDGYAQQVLYKDKPIMISWLGMHTREVYSQYNNHNLTGTLSLPRELYIKNNHLYQNPITHINDYKHLIEKVSSIKENVCTVSNNSSLLIKGEDINNIYIELFSNSLEKLLLEYKNNEVSLNMNFMINKPIYKHFLDDSSNIRSITLKTLYKLEIFIDSCSIEIFINDGEYTLDSLVFPTKKLNDCIIKSNTKFDLEVYHIR